MHRSLALALSSLLLIAAGGREKKSVSSDVASRRAAALTSSIPWKSSIDEALAEAKAEGKLVFWIHMLGSIDGTT